MLREIRATDGSTGRYDPTLPVIVLSGRGSDADRVRGLLAGADDYLVKPFHYPELAARVAAVLRRRERRGEGPRRVGELFIDPSTREVRVGDRRVELANKEFVLLRALAAEPTRVFTKQELLRDVWGFRSEGRTRTLDSHASRLRRKLDPEATRFVFNCWGVGYRLIEPMSGVALLAALGWAAALAGAWLLFAARRAAARRGRGGRACPPRAAPAAAGAGARRRPGTGRQR